MAVRNSVLLQPLLLDELNFKMKITVKTNNPSRCIFSWQIFHLLFLRPSFKNLSCDQSLLFASHIISDIYAEKEDY